MNPDGDNANRWAEQKAASASKLKTGAIVAAAGVVGGIAGNIAINHDNRDKSAELLAWRKQIRDEFTYQILIQPLDFCGFVYNNAHANPMIAIYITPDAGSHWYVIRRVFVLDVALWYLCKKEYDMEDNLLGLSYQEILQSTRDLRRLQSAEYKKTGVSKDVAKRQHEYALRFFCLTPYFGKEH